MVLIVMLMCSEMGDVITPSGTGRLREDGGTKKRSGAIRGGRGSGWGILMSAPEINKEI